MHTVTRQLQWPEGARVVEISEGSIDYSNPGALSAKYRGEFEGFDDPREAVETAIEIAQRWQADEPDKRILIDHGATGGGTMPFDGMPLCPNTYMKLRQWANAQYETLPKCDCCGKPLGKERYTLVDYEPDSVFCSEYCAERELDHIAEYAAECGEECEDE